MNFEKMDKTLIQKIDEYQNLFKSLKEDEPELLIMLDNPTFEIRNNMINWLIFLCNTLNFNIQTLFRAIVIFDKYISKINFDETFTQEKLNLVTIACLSLATKIEEINCNYVSFFTEKVLNMPDSEIFTVKDLIRMEMEILKELKYKTLYTTAVDFMELYLKFFKIYFNADEKFLENVKIICESKMKENNTNSTFVSTCQSEYAFVCFSQALLQLGMNNNYYLSILKNLIINSEEKTYKYIIDHFNEKYKKINDMVSFNLLNKRYNFE